MTDLSDRISYQNANPSMWMGVRGLRKISRPPLWLLGVVASLIFLSFLPLAWIYRHANTKHEEPRIHWWQDMDDQVKIKAQEASPIFADGRGNRLPVAGTVARGGLVDDEHYFLGFHATGKTDDTGQPAFAYYDTYPSQVVIDARTLERGQKYFNIYCTPCHGYDGYGVGRVHEVALQGQESGQNGAWVPPSNLHSAEVRGRPVGHLYETINNGIRNMKGYGSQIQTDDRWAVVAYVKSLQLSQNYPASEMDQQQRDRLTEKAPTTQPAPAEPVETVGTPRSASPATGQ